RHVDWHRIRLPDSTLSPRRIVRSAFDHGTAGRVRHLVGEDALGAIDGRDDVLLREVLKGLGPIYRGHLRREIEHPRGLDEVLLRGVFGEHRANLILFAVEPIDEEHLDSAAAVPVALFVVGTDLAYACAKALRNDGGQGLVSERSCGELPLRCRGAADEADLSA